MSFARELWRFARTQRKYWLIPFIVALSFLGLLIAFGQSWVMLRFVYPLF